MFKEVDELLLSSKFMKQRGYWVNKLPADTERTQLLIKSKKEPGAKKEIEKVNIHIPGELYDRLMKLGKQSDISLYIILATALKILIYRYTDNDEVTLVSPVYKPNKTAETLNQSVYIRDVIDHRWTFIDLLLKIRESALEAYENQDYPSGKLIEYLFGTPPSKTGNPLSDVGCLLSNIHGDGILEDAADRLTFSFRGKENGLDGHILYDAGVYERGYVQLAAEHFSRILEISTLDVKTKISGLSFVSEEEEKKLTIDFNRTAAEYPLEKTLVELFREQAARTPGNPAVVYGTKSVTYKELDEKTDRLARRLRAKHVKAGSIVTVIMERSIEMVIGILAILKAGGAFLPIDEKYPGLRKQFIVENSGSKVLLTHGPILNRDKDKLEDLPVEEIVYVDEKDNRPGDSTAPGVFHTPDDPAYVIYTSGTGGNPKGVSVPHRAILNYIWWAAQTYVKGETVAFPLYTSISFDLTMTSVFTPLLTGNTVVVYGEAEQAVLLDRVFDDNKVGVVKLTPSHLKLIRHKEIDITNSKVKRFIVGGESLERNLALEIYTKFKKKVEIYNEYGPTEAAVGCMIYRFDPGREYGESVPIGNPIDNMQVYILDKNLGMVPRGAVGELCISGEGLAAGYLKGGALTSEKFVAHPFIQGKRLYRSGDLARRLPGGNIEFLGRIDNQVKIRGFRIELGEIESRLLTYENIKEAVVIAREAVTGGEGGDKDLCAYIVSESQLKIAEMREYLSKELPDYMIPPFFIKVESIPLTLNGKIDIRALPEPELKGGENYVAPGDEIEKKLVDLWSEILGRDALHASQLQTSIGIADNFFEIGGNSLKATILMAKVHKEFNIKVPLEAIFNNPTIRGLAESMKGSKEERFTSIEPAEEKEYYKLSSAQRRLYILQRMESSGTSYNVPYNVLLEGKLDFEKLETVFVKLIQRHESLRTSFEMINEEPVQRVHKKVEFRIEKFAATQAGLESTVENFLEPFDLEKAPMLRVGLVKEEEEKHILMVHMHHIVTDGISMNFLITEFTVLYSDKAVPPLRLQYKDFAEQQNSRFHREEIKQQEKYWLSQFKREIPVIDLPLDYPRPPVRSFEGATARFEIPPGETVELNRLALENGVTLYMLLFAIFNVFLSKLSGQEDIIVGTSIAARRHVDLVNIIGMFVNNLPIRNYPHADKTFSDFLMEVKEKTLDAFSNQEYQFEDLVDRVGVKRDTGRNPLFDVLFAMQNTGIRQQELQEVEIPGLKVRPYKTEIKTAKFDIHLICMDKKEKISGTFEYCTKLFKPGTIQEFIKYYREVVSSIIGNPGIKISEIEILSGDEKKRILHERNGLGLEYLDERLLLSSKFMKQRGYWLDTLSGGIEKTRLLIKSKKDPGSKKEIEKVNVQIPGELYERLMKLGKGSDISLYIILATALKLLIYRYTNNEDVIFVSPVFKPNITAETLNEFVYIRDSDGIGHQWTFIDLLLKVRESVLEAYENQDYPSGKLIEYLFDTPPSKTGNPLSDVGCLLSNIHENKTLEETGDRLIFSFRREENRLDGYILYDAGMYERGYVQLVSEYFSRILEISTLDVKTKISGLSFVSEEEEKTFLIDFNRTAAEYPEEKTLVELFREQAARTPGNPAVVYGTKSVTYKELDEKTDQLARRLRAKHVKAGSIVIVIMERSIEMVIGILAILKAGGAFLPIDEKYPGLRKQFIVENSGSKVLLTHGPILDRDKDKLEDLPVEEIVYADEKDNPPGDSTGPGVFHTPDDPAYVIYTSGTGGNPKGVSVPHRAILNYIWWAAQTYVKGETVAFPLYTSISFDLTMTSVFTPLLTGNTVVVYGEAEQAVLLDRVFDDNKVGVVKLTPSHLKLIRHKEIDITNSKVKRFIVGGESLEHNLALEIYTKFKKKVEIYNEYGPTEAAVGCMIYRFDPGREYGESVPIGNPIDNMQVYILDKNLGMVPRGAVGELCISGEGLAVGYLKGGALTSEKFVAHPFIQGKRLYRSGDLARRLPGGNIEFLGRIDSQVKIRGFRIELGEIEGRLLTYETIKEAVVIAREAVTGGEGEDKDLCAYIVSESQLKIAEIREYLSKELPDYMIPPFFIKVESIPLTLNGKIDIRALPEPELKGGENYVAPGDEIEKKLVDLWSEILGRDALHASQLQTSIGIADNFFEIGGNSLKATILMAKIHKEFNVKVPLEVIFNNPAIRELAGYISQSEEDTFTSIHAVEKRDFYPLSSAQKRFYMLRQLGENNTAYNMSQRVLLREDVDKEKLAAIFRGLIARHETLRTSFEIVEGEPVQKVHKTIEFNLRLYKTNEAGLDNVRRNFTRPFDLSEAPLLRVALVEIESLSPYYYLLVEMHHIISDEVSQTLLQKEFLELFNGGDLPPLKLQYTDFSQWENSDARQEAVKKPEAYWLKQFDGELPVLNLPLDFPRPAVQSNEGCTVGFHLPLKDSTALRTVARQEGATMFMILLTVFNIFLAKLCNQEDIVSGTPVAGRKHPDLEKIIGVFINSLALRSFPEGKKTVREFLNEVKTNTLEALENQEYPFEELVEKVMPARETGRNPIFDVMLNLLNKDDFPDTIPENDGDSYTHVKRKVRFDMNLVAVDFGERVFCIFFYCTALFKPETIDRCIEYFKKIVTQLPGGLDCGIADIEILSEAEKHQLLYDFNAYESDYPRTKTVVQLFEEQVRRTPDNVAVVFEDNRLTYRRLNEQANRLGGLLRDKGVLPNTLVSLLVRRSVEMVVGIWGILKSGGAYLPVNPEAPEDRITYMLDNASVTILLTQEKFIEKFSGRYQVINLNSPASYKGSGNNPECCNVPTDLAYVIYTSGSTGKPKGVMIQNRSVINIVKWFDAQYHLQPGFQLLQMFEYTFDASINQIFGSFLHGVTLHVIRKEYFYDIDFLRDYLIDHFINLINFVQSVIKEVLCGNEKIESLKHVISGAEKLKSSVKNEILDHGYTLYNQYGPTEVTVDALAEKCTYESNGTVGVPVYNAQCYIVNTYGGLNPVGVAGELWVSGDGLARGYINNVDLTVEKFVPNPFNPGTRVYKTGDLTRWLPAGNVEFLGRIDNQVKIRGFRIEPVEIANQLVTLDGIGEAVVIGREDDSGDTYLCAYLVGDREIDTAEVKQKLAKKLPDYMIPSAFIWIDQIPLSGHGKLIRSALPVPDSVYGSTETYEAPVNQLEEKLVEIWSEVLNTDKQVIGVNTDFFELGGHSLKATILVSKIHKEFNVKVPLAAIFFNPTIRGLAGLIEGREKEPFHSIAPAAKKAYYPLSSAQKRMYVIQQSDIEDKSYNIPKVVVLNGQPAKGKIGATFKQLIERHESLRTSFVLMENEPVQVIHDFVEFEVEYHESDEEGSRTIIDNSIRPFDLSQAPLLRVGLIKYEEEKYLLVVDMHHIISDGVSFAVLIEDFMELYKGEELPPVKIQYKDFSEWQNNLFESGEMKKQEEYWLNKFKGDLPVLNLPTDYLRPPVRHIDRGDLVACGLDEKLSRKLLDRINETNSTLFIFMLAVFDILLFKYTGREDIVVGSPITGRSHADLGNVIGVFINMLPLRNYPRAHKTVRHFLNEVKETALEAFENQDYPFDMLVNKLGIQGGANRNPLFDTEFAAHNVEIPTIEIPGLKLGRYKKTNKFAKFDLHFLVLERNGILSIVLRYSTELFQHSTAGKILDHYVEILKQVAADLETKLENIPLTMDFLPVESKSSGEEQGSFNF